ncbi:tail collar domain-containing protein [Rhizobium phage RHph_TM16]|nr:tail collar domain-containing protein [Rhizobium phage RHph_TM16]
MTQFDFGTINPATTTGTALASLLGSFRTSLATGHSGIARPTYVQTGQTWLDTSGATWILKQYDGSTDVTLGIIDPATHKWYPNLTNLQAEVTIASAATTDVLGAASARVVVTGTTAITSFGTTPNTIKFVRFSGGLTITNNANIVTNDGANLVVLAGATIIVMSDASGVARIWGSPSGGGVIGQVSYFAMNSQPVGYLKCNGAAYSRTAYSALFAAIGTTYGVGDGSTTFNVPELRGEFIRCLDDGRGIDASRALASAQGSQNLSHAHSISDPGHAHSIADGGHQHYFGASYIGSGIGSNGGYVNASNNNGALTGVSGTGIGIYGAGTGISIVANGGSEARPRNIPMLACIKY